MKKTLFAENTEKAEAFISELQRDYLTPIWIMITGVNGLGIKGVPSKKYLDDLINGNFDQLRSEYWQLAQVDIDKFTSVAAREQMRVGAEEKLEDFLMSLPVLFSAEVDNRSLNDPYFQQFFDIDESGTPFISDSAKEQIFESYREYLTNPKTIRIQELQQKASESLQAYFDALHEAKMDKHLLLIGPWQFLSSAFEIEAIKEDDAVTEFKISVRKLNYDILKGEGV